MCVCVCVCVCVRERERERERERIIEIRQETHDTAQTPSTGLGHPSRRTVPENCGQSVSTA